MKTFVTSARILSVALCSLLIACTKMGSMQLQSAAVDSKSAKVEVGTHDLSGTAVYDLKSMAALDGATISTTSTDLTVDAQGIIKLNVIPTSPQSYVITVMNGSTGNWSLTLDVQIKASDSYALKAWGYNIGGILLDGTTTTLTVPTSPVTSTLKFKQISPGGDHVCGVAEDGTAYCWGANDSGQLGNGGTTASTVPVAVDSTKKFKSVYTAPAMWSGSLKHSCGITIDGKAYCWGLNQKGQLGDNSVTTRLSPVAIASDESFASMALNTSTSCGLSFRGKIFCWGQGSNGELGQGNIADSSAPLVLAGEYFDLTAGVGGYCALGKSDKAFYCWAIKDRGATRYLSNINTSTVDDAMPQILAPTMFQDLTQYQSISGGSASFCGVTLDGTINCWGHHMYGRLGIGNFESNGDDFYGFLYVLAPINTATKFKSIGVGQNMACAVSLADDAWCWGRNEAGTVGVGGSSGDGPYGYYSPVKLNDGSHYAAIVTGGDYSFGFVK